MSSRTLLRITIAALLAAPTAGADSPAAPDTSNWKCASCPFASGYEAEATAGAIVASGANAASGRYTGLDRDKTYAQLGARGDWRDSSGAYARYALDDLGLDARTGRITLGQDGRYAVALSYAGLPHRLYDSTQSPFAGGATLALPSGWVAAGSTAGMSALGGALHEVDIGTLRKTYGIDARWMVGAGWTLYGSAKREDKTGTEILGASFLAQAMQLPAVVDYQTDTVEVGAAWASARMAWRLTLANSNFKDNPGAQNFQNPYLPLYAGATTGRLALPPDNQARQASLAGSGVLPLNSSASVAFGYTELKQNQALLAASTLPGAASGSFDGSVKLTHYGATLGSRPISRLNLHGRVAYEERRDDSTPLTLTQVVTDLVPGATLTTPRYDYDRLRLDGGADYRLLRGVTIGVGGDRLEVDRTQQLVRHTDDGGSYARVRLAPASLLSVTLKGGAAHRQARGFDLTLLPPGENPALALANLANRDRVYFALDATLSPADTVSLALSGQWANDDYRRSALGLLMGHERRIAATLGYTPSETLTFYADGGYQTRATLQAGAYSAASAPWQAWIRDRYWNGGVGGRYVRHRWDATVDYAHATAGGATAVGASGLLGAFPLLHTRSDSARLSVGYAFTPALTGRLRYIYQNTASDDWALDGVGPATLPALLALGAPADAYNVNVVALSLTYRFGTPPAAK
jgi:MtrB/PioB family decaheme-associated outer membrane protein